MPVVDDGEGYEYDDVEKHAVGDGGRCWPMVSRSIWDALLMMVPATWIMAPLRLPELATCQTACEGYSFTSLQWWWVLLPKHFSSFFFKTVSFFIGCLLKKRVRQSMCQLWAWEHVRYSVIEWVIVLTLNMGPYYIIRLWHNYFLIQSLKSDGTNHWRVIAFVSCCYFRTYFSFDGCGSWPH